METKELTTKQKKSCIEYIISDLRRGKGMFICNIFGIFMIFKVKAKDVYYSKSYMHIIFPELYNALKSLVDDDVHGIKYNRHNSRITGKLIQRFFTESNKDAIWFDDECRDRIDFLNDLLETIK